MRDALYLSYGSSEEAKIQQLCSSVIYKQNLMKFNEKYRAIKTSVLCTLSTVQNGDIHIHIYIIYSVCTIDLFKKRKFRFINCPV